MMSRRAFLGLAAAIPAASLIGCTEPQGSSDREGARGSGDGTTAGSAEGAQASANSSAISTATHATADTLISDVISNPLFEGFGRFLFPITFRPPTEGMTLADLPRCLPWYSAIRTKTTLDVVNALIDRRAAGETAFYDIYSAEEKAADPSLNDTGLFHFRAEGLTEGFRAPFSVVCAGGAFAYVASMHDSFPHALHLSRTGYHGFALQYRPDAQLACEDLARGVSFIFAHAEELGVDTDGYALWGGSAGARMAAWVGGYGVPTFGGSDVPQASAVIMQYTGYQELSGTDPATYACVGTADGIAYWQTMRNRLDRLRAAGVPTEFHAYEGLNHGFGLGVGTVAEGWIDDATAFWLRNR